MRVLETKINQSVISFDPKSSENLLSYSPEYSEYEFSYLINVKEALNLNVSCIKIIIEGIDNSQENEILTSNNFTNRIEPGQIIGGLLLNNALKKDSKSAAINNRILEGFIDFTNKVDNSNKESTVTKKDFILLSKENIISSNNIEPILEYSTFVTGNFIDTNAELSIKSILFDQSDPSQIECKSIVNTSTNFQGLISESKKNYNSFYNNKIISKILEERVELSVENLTEESLVPVLSEGQTSVKTVTKRVLLSNNDIRDTFSVKAQLLNKSGVVVDTIQKEVNHVYNARYIKSPTVPPYIKCVALNGKNIISVRQNDDFATSIDLYRRSINRSKNLLEQPYILLDTLILTKKDGILQYTDDVGNASDYIYRAVPRGFGAKLSGNFANAVAKRKFYGMTNERKNKFFHVGIVASSVQEGVKIDVFNLPPGVVSIRLFSRNKTRKQTDYSSVFSFLDKSNFINIDEPDRKYSFLDDSSKLFDIIEYSVLMYYRNGDQELSSTNEIYENIPFTVGIVDTVIKNIQISSNNIVNNVSFDISSKIIDKEKNVLKNLLEEQGFADLYSDELLEEKETLNELIAHRVRRINLNTGQSEYFRPITDNKFDDARLRVIDGIEPLRNRAYRYEISALLRTPETLFERNYKTLSNSIDINVRTLPLKFRHPIVAKTGNVVGKNTLFSHYAQSAFEFGNVGNFVREDVSFFQGKPTLTTLVVTDINANINSLSWRIVGDKTLIDHFIVVYNRYGNEEIIGKAHALVDKDNVEFIHKGIDRRMGSYKYKILPIYIDYTQGAFIESEEIV